MVGPGVDWYVVALLRSMALSLLLSTSHTMRHLQHAMSIYVRTANCFTVRVALTKYGQAMRTKSGVKTAPMCT